MSHHPANGFDGNTLRERDMRSEIMPGLVKGDVARTAYPGDLA